MLGNNNVSDKLNTECSRFIIVVSLSLAIAFFLIYGLFQAKANYEDINESNNILEEDDPTETEHVIEKPNKKNEKYSIDKSFLLKTAQNEKCSINVLKQVCDVCEERSLAKLSTDWVGPSYSETNCPTSSLACIMPDSFDSFLKENYTFTSHKQDGSIDTLLKLNFSKQDKYAGNIKYTVRAQNFRTLLENGTGYHAYDLVQFNIPIYYNDTPYSYNCIGIIDNSAVIKGSCSTITSDENEKLKVYNLLFTATPNTSPLK